MNARVPRNARGPAIVALLMLAPTASCNVNIVEGLTHLVANQTVPNRGAVLVGFVNNTNARAIMTFGSYDQFDERTVPAISQLRLGAMSSSAQITIPCHRVFSVGGVDLIRLIKSNNPNAVTDPQALITGVNFSRAPADTPEATLPTNGTAAPRNLENGVDYYCNGLLLFTFVEDPTAAGGNRIDFQFFPRQ